jgi:hypothetical protein
MPYEIVKKKSGKYEVINRITGKIHAKGTTLNKAKAQVRLLESRMRGAGTCQSGQNGRRVIPVEPGPIPEAIPVLPIGPLVEAIPPADTGLANNDSDIGSISSSSRSSGDSDIGSISSSSVALSSVLTQDLTDFEIYEEIVDNTEILRELEAEVKIIRKNIERLDPATEVLRLITLERKLDEKLEEIHDYTIDTINLQNILDDRLRADVRRIRRRERERGTLTRTPPLTPRPSTPEGAGRRMRGGNVPLDVQARTLVYDLENERTPIPPNQANNYRARVRQIVTSPDFRAVFNTPELIDLFNYLVHLMPSVPTGGDILRPVNRKFLPFF